MIFNLAGGNSGGGTTSFDDVSGFIDIASLDRLIDFTELVDLVDFTADDFSNETFFTTWEAFTSIVQDTYTSGGMTLSAVIMALMTLTIECANRVIAPQ